MACNWNLAYRGAPNDDGETIACRCRDCGKVKNLPCYRDWTTGQLVVEVETCAEKRAMKGK